MFSGYFQQVSRWDAKPTDDGQQPIQETQLSGERATGIGGEYPMRHWALHETETIY